MKTTIKFYMCGGETHKTNCEVPIGIGYLMSNCTHKNYVFQYVEDKKELKDCDVIALSSCASGAREAIEILCDTTKPVIIGGQISLWENLNIYNFAHIVHGEGELSLYKILSHNNAPKNVISENISELDVLKFPYRGKPRGNQVMIITSRGCPYSCAFCSSQKYWKKVRYHSADYIIDEVKDIAKRFPNVTHIDIADDLFASHKKRLVEIHDKWLSNDLHKRFALPACFIRSNIFDDEICLLLKGMGIRKVRFGGESASNRMLKLLNKQTTVENHINTIEVCQRNGMSVSASFMFDIPGETEEDKQMTLDFIKRYNNVLGNGGRYKFKAFPGTQFYDGSDITKLDMNVR